MRNRLFETVKIRPPRKNVFDLSHEKRLSANFATLTPIYTQEVIPGDSFRGTSELLIRLAPMVTPVMHRMNAYVHYFFVPNRLVWDNWKTFITGGVDGKQAPTIPTLTITEQLKQYYVAGTLADYLGAPVVKSGETVTTTMNISALPFRMYQLIYNEYYRDQTLQTEVPFDKGDTENNIAECLRLRRRCWEKDYFTSALPWTQRGDDVLLPNTINYYDKSLVKKQDGSLPTTGDLTYTSDGVHLSGDAGVGGSIQNIESMEVTINDLRTSARLQEYLEKMARAGSRYVEQILALFGVMSDDLQQSRPQYLGGGKLPIVISEVLASFQNETVAQGTMAGHGISVGATPSFKGYFKEHGYIFGILSVIPRSAYVQSSDRTLYKTSKFDYFTPDFANLGEQPVYNKELFYDTTIDGATWNNGVFGYQSRYAEYKHNRSTIHGAFRDTLDYWHLGRIFDTKPALNEVFVECDPDEERIFASQDTSAQKMFIQIYNNIKAIRPIPVYGTPRL